MSYQPTDQDLLSRLSADPAAFEVFYRRHVDRVIGFTARRVRDPADVADLVAATFLAVLTAARSYDPGRGEPTAWLLGIARRLIVNAHRRGARELAAMTRIAGHRLIDASDIERLEERIDAARSSEVALDALSRLRPRAQEVILLVSVDGLSPGEAAQVLGISAAACRVRLSRARRALGKAIDAVDAGAAPQPARNASPAPAPARNSSPAPTPARNSSLERTSGDYRYAR
jgi:RNA polymerase sigma factor (sigma-70 family)